MEKNSLYYIHLTNTIATVFASLLAVIYFIQELLKKCA